MIRRQYTCAVFIVYNDKLLLLFHRKLKRWLPPGGKIENNELPQEAALREVKEEVGLDIQLISYTNQSFSCQIPVLVQPHHMQIETMPDGCENIDFIFHSYPLNTKTKLDTQSATEYRWLNKQQLKELLPQGEMLENSLLSIDLINEITKNH